MALRGAVTKISESRQPVNIGITVPGFRIATHLPMYYRVISDTVALAFLLPLPEATLGWG